MSIPEPENNFVIGISIMKSSYQVRNQLIRQLQEEFSRAYPYLKIEFLYRGAYGVGYFPAGIYSEDQLQHGVKDFLEKDIRIADDMKVSELEDSLHILFGEPVQVYRRSGKFWM